jgi:hypothetical protein
MGSGHVRLPQRKRRRHDHDLLKPLEIGLFRQGRRKPVLHRRTVHQQKP